MLFVVNNAFQFAPVRIFSGSRGGGILQKSGIASHLRSLGPRRSMMRIHSSEENNEDGEDDISENSEIEATNDRDFVLPDGVIEMELNDELKASFLSYAMSTILGRALPDARDGLKPVHRRVLYAMHGLNLLPSNTYRKCARVVGEVLGKYHPHGDMSVYDALVRMAQNFVMLHPLVAGHGNFGSIDNDPAAAMRYTEAKLSSLAYDALLLDIKENTVDFVDNFDGNEVEPVVLPARVPLLLLNGASGIAVGMATNIPPHNLGELSDAVIAIISNPELTEEELLKIVPGPDFPTAGKIMGNKGAQSLYTTGRGSVVMRATSHIENISTRTKGGATKSRNAIIITELPYMTNKSGLLEKLADLVNDKKIDGIADLRDESDRDGIRVVVELKRDAVPAVVQNNLFKKTALQTTFSGNMLALVDNGRQPQRITLRKGLDIFIAHRFDTIRRRTSYQLENLKSRDHLVEGMILALGRIDDLIDLLRKSSDSAAAKKVLMSEEYALSTEQADSILGLRLSRLTAMEENKLKNEHQELITQIAELDGVMQDSKKVYSILVEETLEIKKKHGSPRKTEILGEEGQLNDEDLLANDRSVIIITHSGYIKRIPIEEFEAQSRGTKGKAGTRLSADNDGIAQFFSCNDHDAMLFVTDKGVAYSLKAYQVPLGSRIAKGVPLPQVLPINSEEKVTSVIPIESFDREDEHLVLLTKNGFVKKTKMSNFKSVSARGLIIISLSEGDSLGWTRRCVPDEEVMIATRDGFACRFSVNDLTSTGRTSRGVRALNLRDGDQMADIDICSPVRQISEDNTDNESFVFAVTERGFGKRIPVKEFRLAKRGGRGVYAIKFKDKAGGGGSKSRAQGSESKGRYETDALCSFRYCSVGDEIVISTNKGTILRQKVDDVSVQTRAATGVLIQKIAKDDAIVMVDVIPPEIEEVLIK